MALSIISGPLENSPGKEKPGGGSGDLDTKKHGAVGHKTKGAGNEIQLTDALSKMLPDDQFIVIESGDYHFDVGNLKGLELAERYINNNPF